MDKFWCLRCLIGLFVSGTNASLMAKNRNRKLSQPFVDRYWYSSSLNNCIKVPNMIGSFASGATASLVAKNRTKIISAIWRGILMFKLSKWPYQSGIIYIIQIYITIILISFAGGATASLVAKNVNYNFVILKTKY